MATIRRKIGYIESRRLVREIINRLYQDLECIMPHDESSSVGGAYAKLRRGNPTSREFTGHDGVNRASIHGTAAPFRGCIGGLSAGPHDRWAPPYEPSL